MPRLVLASRSPRRSALLRQIGVECEVSPVEVDERERPGEDPVDYVRRIALAKAEAAVAREASPAWILAADTTVWFDAASGPIGKPEDRAHATTMLRRLMTEGPHFVTTAFVLVEAPHGPREVCHVTTRVFMRVVDDARLSTYLDENTWSDKAGGYAVQESAAAFVTRVEGSYTNVVGLPLAEVAEALERRGLR